MVTTHSQYITDFTPKTMEPGKSPLAMLAKTCETIGLPEAPSKKSPVDKKDVKVEASVPTTKMPKSSPRSTPAAKEATLTFPGLPKPSFPMGMPTMPFPFFNPMMMPCPMPFPGFPMSAGYGARMPCPFAMMRQPCLTPGCTQCVPTSSAASAQPQFTPEMMAQFAAHPLFAAYAGMMPQVSVAPTSMPSYQSLLASVAASTSSAAAAANTTQRASPKTKVPTSTPSTSTATPTNTKHRCAWMESNGICGKKFADEEELANHIKLVHTPSPPSSASSTSAELSVSTSSKTPTSSRPASSASQFRYNPYGKPNQSHLPNSLPTTPMMPQMAMNPMMLPFPLQAMYTQRLMSSMPHQ